ncbi:hypothetical protein BpHYR1_010021 [Brachionus plicatilis]|uniref:Uncharacterized protein n=1 Tax=Brachionus plicatilis TaxID=10195 RepID=A0A3M7QEE1_BRAPC|nr:hypothetical protein BpHYR1_010021 [Brachionus plicatilis]
MFSRYTDNFALNRELREIWLHAFIHSKEIDNFDLLSEVEMLKEESDSLSEPHVLKNENKQAI